MINPIGIQKHVGKKWTVVLAVLSFIIPLAVWSVVSYVPFVYHPLVKVVDAGGSMFCQPGDEIERVNFEEENKSLLAAGEKAMTGVRINPAYLPAPHKVAKALVTAFMTEPKRDGDVWFYESILHSVKIVFLEFIDFEPPVSAAFVQTSEREHRRLGGGEPDFTRKIHFMSPFPGVARVILR